MEKWGHSHHLPPIIAILSPLLDLAMSKFSRDNRFLFGVHTPLIATQSARAGDLWMFVFETMSLNLDLATSTWNPKQPFINGWKW